MAFVAYERKIPVKGDYDVIVAGAVRSTDSGD